MEVTKTQLGKLGIAAFSIAIATLISAALGPEIRTAYVKKELLWLLFYGLFIFFMAWFALIIVVYQISPKSKKKKG